MQGRDNVSQKDLLPIFRELKLKGWIISKTKTGSGHHRVVAPCGTPMTLPSTPSDWRGLKNAKADIRRIEGRAEA